MDTETSPRSIRIHVTGLMRALSAMASSVVARAIRAERTASPRCRARSWTAGDENRDSTRFISYIVD
jgi:hypothetical protein